MFGGGLGSGTLPGGSSIGVWGFCVTLAAILWGCQGGGSASDPPNIVLIIVDTLRADAVSGYGLPLPTTPEIDDLATRGVRFDRAITQCTWTRPSIGSMLTSLHPRTLGLYDERDEVLADHFVTLAEILQEHGYTTLGATANPVINSYYGFHQGFDWYLDTDVVFEWMPVSPESGVRGADGRSFPTAAELLAAVRRGVREKGTSPYYVQVDVMDVHEFNDTTISLGSHEDLFPQASDNRRRRYLQTVRVVSDQIGRFVHDLSALEGWEHTLFVITSDHGESLNDHPALAEPNHHGWLVYESQTCVPLILCSTGDDLPRGVVVEHPVRLLDLAPTVLDYAGLIPPPSFAGRSLLPSIRGETEGLPAVLMVETQFREANKIAAYATGWHYIENRDAHGGTDVRELQARGVRENGAETNLIDRYPDVADRLETYLEGWEASHPPAKPTRPTTAPSDSLVRTLRSLGYLN